MATRELRPKDIGAKQQQDEMQTLQNNVHECMDGQMRLNNLEAIQYEYEPEEQETQRNITLQAEHVCDSLNNTYQNEGARATLIQIISVLKERADDPIRYVNAEQYLKDHPENEPPPPPKSSYQQTYAMVKAALKTATPEEKAQMEQYMAQIDENEAIRKKIKEQQQQANMEPNGKDPKEDSEAQDGLENEPEAGKKEGEAQAKSDKELEDQKLAEAEKAKEEEEAKLEAEKTEEEAKAKEDKEKEDAEAEAEKEAELEKEAEPEPEPEPEPQPEREAITQQTREQNARTQDLVGNMYTPKAPPIERKPVEEPEKEGEQKEHDGKERAERTPVENAPEANGNMETPEVGGKKGVTAPAMNQTGQQKQQEGPSFG